MCLFLIIFVSPIGPSSWYKNYPVAEGNRQSPIDIVPNEASHDRDLGPIMTNYDHCTSINISNNGHSVVVEFNDSDDRSGEKIVLFLYLFVLNSLQRYSRSTLPVVVAGIICITNMPISVLEVYITAV